MTQSPTPAPQSAICIKTLPRFSLAVIVLPAFAHCAENDDTLRPAPASINRSAYEKIMVGIVELVRLPFYAII
jgi:hypothetical protein